MKRVALFIFLVFWGFFQAGYGQGSETRYDVEYARICLIDSIAPGNLVQFWRFTQANNPGALALDYEYDLGATYTVAGTVLPCCSCLTAASDTAARLDDTGERWASAGPWWRRWSFWGVAILAIGVFILKSEKHTA
jgi:hypothetical protein